MDATPPRPSPFVPFELSEPSSPTSPSSPAMAFARRCARRLERTCWVFAKYFPLFFVYGLTTWAVAVLVSLCGTPSNVAWLGKPAATLGVSLYLLLNWCYTTAVFTPPGSTTNDHGYSTLPTHAAPTATSFTVKSNGELRFCKKCQARKPDRAHHCSTCRRCVLKMDHHCPWLATCVGLRNHKPFLLFLIYTTFFSLFCFAASGAWVWEELFVPNQTYVENLMPVNFIILCVVSGIIGLVIGAFCGWHIYLASRGQTTIECLEKTRYLSPLRRSMHQTYVNQHTPGQGISLPSYGQQLLEIHQNVLPGITRPEEGEELRREPTPLRYESESASPQGGPHAGPQIQAGSRRFTYDEMERHRARRRHEEYLDEQDSSKLPNAFDLGPRRNLLHLFGPNPWLWPLPVCNTSGDGWSWEPNPHWADARERLARERAEQAERERIAGWGAGDDTPVATPTFPPQHGAGGAGRHYLQAQPNHTTIPGRKSPSKADRILGRDPNLYADQNGGTNAVSMKRLSPAGRTIEDELDAIDRELATEDDDDDDDSDDDKPLAIVKQKQQQQQQTQKQPPPPPPPPHQKQQPERKPLNTTTTTTTTTTTNNARWPRRGAESPVGIAGAGTLLRGAGSPGLGSPALGSPGLRAGGGGGGSGGGSFSPGQGGSTGGSEDDDGVD